MNTEVMFSSNKDDWETPQELFDKLDQEFHFTLDVCADENNHKCDKYYTKAQDGLEQEWIGNVIWCNPPYGREIANWVRKAYYASEYNDVITVMLLPARTDTRWFHEYIYNKPNVEIRFLKGRLKFGGVKNSAPFPSMIVIFRFGLAAKK